MKKNLSIKTIVAIGIGAAVFMILGRFGSIPSGIPNTNIETSYVVLASKGYPGSFVKGYSIDIKEEVKDKVFIAGAKLEDEILKTNGGRVLSVVGVGNTIEEAREDAYKAIEKVNFKDKYYRNDIGIV